MTSNQIQANANAIQARHNTRSEELESERNSIASRQASESERHNATMEELQADQIALEEEKLRITQDYNDRRLALDQELGYLENQARYATLENQRAIQDSINEINAERNRIQAEYNQAMIEIDRENQSIESFRADTERYRAEIEAKFRDESIDLQREVEANKLLWEQEYGLRQLALKQEEIDIDRESLRVKDEQQKWQQQVAQMEADTNRYKATTQRLEYEFNQRRWNTEKWFHMIGGVGEFTMGVGTIALHAMGLW